MKQIPLKGWLSWFLGAAFFYVMYVARLTPGVMTKELMAEFHVTASSLGYLSMLFFYPYLLLQIPAGIFVDRFGPKLLLIIAVSICGVACFFFSQATSYPMAMLSRLFFGIGAAFAFVTSLKLAAIWFPASRIGLIAGLTQTMGMLGAATGEQPVAKLVQWVGWRQSLLIEVSLFAVLLVLITLFVSDNRRASKNNPSIPVPSQTKGSEFRNGAKRVLLNPQSWLVGLYTGFIFAPTVAFAELWGNSFLRVAYGYTSERAAFSIGLVFIGWAIGGPIFGWLSDITGRRKPWLWIASVMSAVTLLTVIYVGDLPFWAINVLFLVYGIFNTGVVVAYAVASEINPKFVAGISLGIANMLTIIVGALSQPLIGEMLDGISKQYDPLNYSVADYQHAFIALPISFILSFLIIFLIKETFCRSLPVSAG